MTFLSSFTWVLFDLHCATVNPGYKWTQAWDNNQMFFSNTDAFRDELGVMKRNYDANFDEKFSFEEFSKALKQNKHLKEFIFDIKYL